MTSKAECAICQSMYDSENNKPLMLPCGHSFCKTCLDLMVQKRLQKVCPTCRVSWEKLHINNIPVCYQLLPEEEANPLINCSKHSIGFTFWCQTCQMMACKLCLTSEHRQCEFEVLEQSSQQLAESIETRYHIERHRITQELASIETTLARTSSKISNLKRLNEHILKSGKELVLHQEKLLKYKENLIHNSKLIAENYKKKAKKLKRKIDDPVHIRNLVLVRNSLDKLKKIKKPETVEDDPVTEFAANILVSHIGVKFVNLNKIRLVFHR